MSDTQDKQAADIDEVNRANAAAADFELYRKNFETKYGFGIGATSQLTPDGRVSSILQLVKVLPPAAKPSTDLSEEEMKLAEVPDPTTPDVNPETETTSQSDSSEQPEGQAAQ